MVGVDECAMRKGRIYGTVLVDVETRRPVDLLPDREAGTVGAWPAEHPSIEVIRRDRAPFFAEGAGIGAPVHVSTLLTREIPADRKWADKLTDADRRALSPLFWTHVNPYGRFELDMNSGLDLDLSVRATVSGPRTPRGEAAVAPT